MSTEENKNQENLAEEKNNLEEQVAQTKEVSETDELKERLLRLAAEFDNYKKRTAKEVEAAKNLGKIEMIRKLLPAIDELELALAAMKGNGNDQIKGVELVYSNLLEVLKVEGLAVMDAKGKADPFKHEVMLVKESDEEEGTILEVIRKGYTFKEMLIRPASVIVSKGREEKLGE
ncbi:MAG: nucleotide exchange factor GrpE [Candidatus Micrarchaeota archaeon]|nr:nucleotide exchange factor GrpE [Candidatus Micrarchaeota archaeon]